MITWKRIDQKVPCMQIISLVVERIFIKKFSISLVDFLKKKKKGGEKGWSSWVKSNCANPRYNELDVTSSPGVGIDLRSIFLSGNRPVS